MIGRRATNPPAWIWGIAVLVALACRPEPAAAPPVTSPAPPPTKTRQAHEPPPDAWPGASGSEPTRADPKDRTAVQPPPTPADPPAPAGTCPAKPSPGFACSPYNKTCDYPAEDKTCVCQKPCMGAYDPERDRTGWQCSRRRDHRCPTKIPEAGTRCSPNGLRCGYGHCAITSAHCTSGRWQLHHTDPPA